MGAGVSITTSREERDQAADRLAAKSDEQLRDELAYWSVALQDHKDRWLALTDERHQVADLMLEAQAWTGLVTEQLQARKRRRGVS